MAGCGAWSRWRSGEFNVTVIRALGIDELLAKRRGPFREGNCRLRQSPYASVGMPTCISLDEPSAHLDANARMEAARRSGARWSARNDRAFVIDHDVYFIDIVE